MKFDDKELLKAAKECAVGHGGCGCDEEHLAGLFMYGAEWQMKRDMIHIEEINRKLQIAEFERDAFAEGSDEWAQKCTELTRKLNHSEAMLKEISLELNGYKNRYDKEY